MMLTDAQKQTVIDAVNHASAQWQGAFNGGDAAGCANQYESTAVMHARPFGTFTGTEAIQAFWQKLMDDGFAEVQYVDPKVEVLDADNATLSSGWSMNKARGVIHKESWQRGEDGVWRLRADHFEVTG